jgi:hypothetical protein
MKLASSVFARRIAVVAALSLPLAAVAAPAEEKATVVYVSGNQIVVNNASNGAAYGYTLGAGDTLKTDSGSVPASGLKVGSVITGGLKGSGSVVDDASVVKATVISVAPPNKMVVKVDGENKEVSLADGALAGAKAGDSVQLTLVSVRTDGDNRPISPVTAPPLAGKLAFFKQPNLEQPDSGTNLPTYGVIGGLLLAVGFGLKSRRRATN